MRDELGGEYYCPWDGALKDVTGSAERSASWSGQVQRVHRHAKDPDSLNGRACIDVAVPLCLMWFMGVATSARLLGGCFDVYPDPTWAGGNVYEGRR